MLLPAEVRPFLLHEDREVRDLALDYLGQAHDAAPATQEDLWEVIDRYGETPDRRGGTERMRVAFHLRDLPATEPAALRLLEALRAEPDPRVLANFARAAAELPPEMLPCLLEDERIVRRMEADTIAAWREDLELSTRSCDALWEALDECVTGLGPRDTVGSPFFARAQRVVRALARHGAEGVPRGLAILQGPLPETRAGFWWETFASMLFGRVRLPALEERLLAIVGDEDGDFGNDRAVDALVRVGTPEVIAAVEERLPSSGPTFALYALGVLARIKRPESEAALVRLLGRDDVPCDPTVVAMHLCDLCTTSREALGGIERMVLEGDYDPMLVDLADLLLTAGKMVGWAPADPAAWEARPRLVPPIHQAIQDKLAAVQKAGGPPPAPSAKRRGFVPYGKKARRKKKG
jgi:hypothetical protein